jgi:hypothetical protein
MELQLPSVSGRARRLAALSAAHPVVGRGERRLPAMVTAQRFTPLSAKSISISTIPTRSCLRTRPSGASSRSTAWKWPRMG